MDANIDYYYDEYGDITDGRYMFLEVNGQIYVYDFEKLDSNPLILNDIHEFSTNYAFARYFEQRPDVKQLYIDINESLRKSKKIYDDLIIKVNNELNTDLESEKANLEMEISELENKKDEIISDVYDYCDCLTRLEEVNKELKKYEQWSINLLGICDEKIKSNSSISDLMYYSNLKLEFQKYDLLLQKKQAYEDEVKRYITSAISLDDVKSQLKGYNSSKGIVPAGEWDTWINSKYTGYGYETGMIGSFEGPQGKETGYDSRKGDEKLNYKDPDRSLLKFLSEVTDKYGNILYPAQSFEKGGKYYYHIFGVNDDGSINFDLIDNPRFGCKMLGNYLLVGADQRLNRERGSKVMTSLGPAIIFDYGKIEDLNEDPSHIDISMDEVLFWLKDFSHNENRKVESLAGIYEWCTTNSYDGTIDFNYEHMERNYVNNLNVKYNANLSCIFDYDDFKNETCYDNQEQFVYTLS